MMSETQSARSVGLTLGGLLILVLMLNAVSRTAEADDADKAPLAAMMVQNQK